MKKILLTLFVLLTAAALSVADTIFLNDGQVLTGDIISESADSVIVDTYGGSEETIGRSFIKRIVREENYYNYRRMMRKGYASGGQWYNDEWIFKIGIDFDGTHDVSNGSEFLSGTGNLSINGSQHVNSGMTVGGEYVSYITKTAGIGGGLDIQSLRGLSDGSGGFSFMPLYGLVKLRTNPDKRDTYEYLIAQAGYNFFSADRGYASGNASLDGGLYWGLGAGVCVRRIQFELLYTEDRGKIEDSGYLYNPATGFYDTYFSESGDIKYSKFGLNVGFIF